MRKTISQIVILILLSTSLYTPTLASSSSNMDSLNISAMIATGGHHSLAIKDDGALWSWGYNGTGQLGNGTTKSSKEPVKVKNLTGVIATAADEDYSLALESNGTVWAWGLNEYGQLGNGSTRDSLEPVQVPDLTGVVAIAAGVTHALALKSDGTVWAWGRNLYGQIGDATIETRKSPVKVRMLSGIVAISAGSKHSLALKEDGTVWAWGYNSDGELGIGTDEDSNVPVQVEGLDSVVGISAGYFHNMAVKSDGTVWVWGDNTYSQLGNATNGENSTVPRKEDGVSGVVSISGGARHSIVLESNGTVWSWGYNNYGQLGNGKNSEAYEPVQVVDIPKISAIATHGYHSLAAESNGTVWAWGNNESGQLGDGSTYHNSIAMEVKSFSLLEDSESSSSSSNTNTSNSTTVPSTGDSNMPGDSSSISLCVKSQTGCIVLEWNKSSSSDITGYYIYRAEASNDYSDPLTDFPVTGTSYTDNNTESGVKYYYIVKPVYTDGSEGSASNEVSATLKSSATQQTTIVLQVDNPCMTVNGTSKEIDPGKGTAPTLIGGRTFVPIRAIIEEMGGNVSWETNEQKISITLSSKKLEMWIGKKSFKVNGQNKKMDVAPLILKGRTMLPLRFVTENLGCNVQWDGTTKKITITFDGTGNISGSSSSASNSSNSKTTDNKDTGVTGSNNDYYVKDGKQFILDGKVLFTDYDINCAILSPDKNYVVYTTTYMEINVYDVKKKATNMIYEMSLSDGMDGWRVSPEDWTSDSKYIIFERYYNGLSTGGNKYYKISRSGGDPVVTTYTPKS